jgi:multimeric flavodoxin WrbA
MREKTVIIIGSSRNNGNTTRIANSVASQNNYDVVNLNNYEFSYYDYESKNRDDDFFPLVKEIIENYDTIIFATPIYWYSMSGIMKVFLDRFSDLVRVEKETGRKLRGKRMGVISNSGETALDYDFYIPFKKSAQYLGMQYIGDMHINAETLEEKNIEIAFI